MQVSEEVPAYLSVLYDVKGKVGEGTYGLVYVANTRDPQRKLIAIKTFKPGKEGDGISVTAIREIMLLRELRHPNIVKLEAVHISREESSLSLAFGLADMDLYEMVRYHREKDRAGNPDAGFHPYTLKSLVWQMLKGITAMHKQWMLHRDLKPSNLLVVGQGPETGTLKIADFGLARIFQGPLRPLSSNGVVVTIWYRAPELILGAQHYTPALDVWAIGCIFGELITLKPLFQGEERKHPPTAFQANQMDKIAALLGAPRPKEWPELMQLQHWRDNTEDVVVRLSKNLVGASHLAHYIHSATRTKGIEQDGAAVDLLRRLLTYNPNDRITAEEALEHPYFKEAPLPGNNAFFHHSTRVASYPKRSWLPPAAPLAANPDGSYREPSGPSMPAPSRAHTPYKAGTRENTPGRGVSPAPALARGLPRSTGDKPGLPKRRRTDHTPGFR